MILDVSKAVIDAIHAGTPDLGDWVELHSLSSADAAPSSTKASLALVAVAPHAHALNRPLVEGAGGALVRAPLALKLTYVATWFGNHDEAQTRLARIVQALHTTPVLAPPQLQPPLRDAVDSIAIRMLSPTSDERNQIWGALGRPGRLALFYEVDVAPVPVLEREGAGRVDSHVIRYVGAP